MSQVTKEHYRFDGYSHLGRFASYFHQLREVLALEPHSVLEVGVGDKVFGEYLKNNTNVAYTSIDVAPDLKPDVIGSVTQMPFPSESFDVVCIFEVLEHLPFTEFEKALCELSRVSRNQVVMSLPHFGPPVKFLLKIPFLPEMRFAWKVTFPKKHTFNGEHYWEIGKSGYPVHRILNILEKYFIVTRHFVPFENQYHHFFILTKRHE